MLKTIVLLKKWIFERQKVGDGKINAFNIDSSMKIAKKLRKLKSKKLSKFQKLVSQKKSHQKVGIYLILMLKKTGQAF